MATILQGPAIPIKPINAGYYGTSSNGQNMDQIPSSSYFGTSISGQLNDHLKHKQQTAAQTYMSAALLFEKMEENISKNVLKLIGVQKNKDNMMVATICNVIDTLVSNFVGIFDERFKFALDQMEIKRNKNNMNLMNNINKLNTKMSDIIIKMDENDKINGIKKTLEILLNEIDDIKSSIQQSGELRKKIVKNTEKWEKKMDDKLNEISNKFNKFEKNVDMKENVRMENINNKMKKMENNLINKLNTSPDRMVNKLEEINVKILKIQKDFEASAMSNFFFF